MRQITTVLAIVAVLILASVSVALADTGVPVGGCPDLFELHQMHMDEGDGMHHHIGDDADQNGDGFLCMKHVGVDGHNHVHVDNAVR